MLGMTAVRVCPIPGPWPRPRPALSSSGRRRRSPPAAASPSPVRRLDAARPAPAPGQPPLVDQVDWARVHVFFGDERCVPPDDERSNFRMADETLLSKVPIPNEQIHRMRGELPPAEAAADYEHQLRGFFGDEPPRLDLILLGMGDNGHTASLFPGLTAVHEQQRWVVAEYVAEVEHVAHHADAGRAQPGPGGPVSGGGAGRRTCCGRCSRDRTRRTSCPAQVVRPAPRRGVLAGRAAAAAE